MRFWIRPTGAFPLVNGFEETKTLLKIMSPEVLMPLRNGAIDQSGVISPLVTESGSIVRGYLLASSRVYAHCLLSSLQCNRATLPNCI